MNLNFDIGITARFIAWVTTYITVNGESLLQIVLWCVAATMFVELAGKVISLILAAVAPGYSYAATQDSLVGSELAMYEGPNTLGISADSEGSYLADQDAAIDDFLEG